MGPWQSEKDLQFPSSLALRCATVKSTDTRHTHTILIPYVEYALIVQMGMLSLRLESVLHSSFTEAQNIYA
jgi:hypothetical protein